MKNLLLGAFIALVLVGFAAWFILTTEKKAESQPLRRWVLHVDRFDIKSGHLSLHGRPVGSVMTERELKEMLFRREEISIWTDGVKMWVLASDN